MKFPDTFSRCARLISGTSRYFIRSSYLCIDNMVSKITAHNSFANNCHEVCSFDKFGLVFLEKYNVSPQAAMLAFV